MQTPTATTGLRSGRAFRNSPSRLGFLGQIRGKYANTLGPALLKLERMLKERRNDDRIKEALAAFQR